MTDELITYETALMAKERGFDIPVMAMAKTTGRFSMISGPDNHNSFSGSISLPTQFLLQRWLREVHRIYVTVLPYREICEAQDDLSWYCSVVDDRIDEEGQLPQILLNEADLNTDCTDSDAYDTYELALEACLQEALKLIPEKL